MLKALVKDTAVYGLTDFIFRFLNFAIFPILTYILTVGEFGVYALLTTLALLIATIFNCGLNRALERFYLDATLDKRQQAAAVSMGLLLEGLFALLFIIPGVGLAYTFREGLYEHQQVGWIALAIALVGCLPTQLFQLATNGLRLNFLPWHFTLLNIFQNGLSLCLSLYFVIVMRWGVAGFLGGMAIGYSAAAPLAIALLYRRVPLVFDWSIAKGMLHFGYPFVFVDVARWIFTSMDRWMLAEWTSTIEVGLYSMAFKLSTVLIFLIGAFSLAWTPHALKAYRDDPNHRVLYSYCLTLWFFLLTLMALSVHLFGTECLMLLTPPAYWPAARLLPCIATGLALFGTTYVSVINMMVTKRTSQLTLTAWMAAGLNILLNLCWIPLAGAQGSAAAELVTYGFLATYYLIVAQQLYPLPLEYGKLAICLTLLLGGAALSSGLNAFPWQPVLLLPKGAFLLGTLYVGYRLHLLRFTGIKSAVELNYSDNRHG